MAETALNLADEDTAAPERSEFLTLAEILQPDVNLADMLPDAVLSRIGAHVTRDYKIDCDSRDEWLEGYDRWLNIAMQVREAKNTPWPNASNVKYPLLTVASIQFQARAYPAIVDGANLVKGRVLGPDPDGTKRARADRIGQHMTWQLLYRMPGWEEDTDRMLLMLPITGTVIRKTFYDSIAGANRSEMISAKDFVINYMAKSIEAAPRYTHVLQYYPYEVLEKVNGGLWLPVQTQAEGEAANDDDALVEFYEQHRLIDIDGDGYPEPYVVTTNTDGQVARIVPCFGAEDITVNAPVLAKPVKLTKLAEGGELPQMQLTIVRIERRQYFTKYGFIPSPDGSFYDRGFGALLDDISSSVDTTINQLIDAGSLQNSQGGFIGDGVTIRSGDKPFRLGEWKRMSVTGGALKDNIVPLALPGPSAVLFNLLGMLIEAAKEITAVQDVMTGQGTANQPATTTLALIEQGHKVMSGIFKRIHRAFGQELRILRRLNRDYLDEEEYFNLTDPVPQMGEDGQPVVGPDGNPVMTDAVKVGREDYEDEDLDVIPVSDPSVVSDMQKMARAESLLPFNGDPLVNQVEIRRRYFEATGQRDIKALLEVPQPAPDPKVLAEGAKIALEGDKAKAAKVASDAKAAKDYMDGATSAVALGLVADAAAMAEAAVDLTGGPNATDADAAMPVGPGAVPGMDEPPGDGGIPPDVAGPPMGAGDGMGGGEIPDGGGAGAGPTAGPAGSDQF